MSRLTTWDPRSGRGVWSLLGPVAAEPVGLAPVDWIGLDAQHGFYDDHAVREALRLLPESRDAIVRVPANDAAWIGRVLDGGARGVIVPMVETPEQAAAAAAACRYPAAGRRSWGQFAEHWGRAEASVDEANGRVVCGVMVETRLGLDNVDAIAAVAGVDLIYVGPFDLSIALGLDVDQLLGGGGGELVAIVEACRRHDVIPGAFAGSAQRSERLERLGFEVLAVTTDRQILTSGSASVAAHALAAASTGADRAY